MISDGLTFRWNVNVCHLMLSTHIPVFISSLTPQTKIFCTGDGAIFHFFANHFIISFLLHISSLLPFAFCFAWGFTTNLILFQHVKFVLIFSIQFGTCPAAVNCVHLLYIILNASLQLSLLFDTLLLIILVSFFHVQSFPMNESEWPICFWWLWMWGDFRLPIHVLPVIQGFHHPLFP